MNPRKDMIIMIIWMTRCCFKWLFKHSFVKNRSEVHVFEIATPRRQSQHKQNKSLVVKWYKVKTFPCLGHYMDTLSLLGCEFFYSCDGGVSFIMSLHSKQICVEWVFNTHFSQTDNDKVPLSRRVIITFTFLFWSFWKF